MPQRKTQTKLTQTISNIVIENIDKKAIKKAAFDAGYWDPDELHNYIRINLLRNGKTRCNTAELANLYTYAYGLVHVDAFQEAAVQTSFSQIYFDDYEHTLLVDFGCGPGTVALALAEMWEAEEGEPEGLPINYLGIDIENGMLLLAEDFFNTPIFDEGLEITRSNDFLRVRNGVKPQKIIFVFNYLFSQKGISAYIEKFITRMKVIIQHLSEVEDIYLMYSNIDYCGEKNAFQNFLERLKEEGMLNKSQNTYIPSYEYNFRKFNNLDGENIDYFEGTPRYVYTEIFTLYRP